MKSILSKVHLILVVTPVTADTAKSVGPNGYLIGGIIALFIMCYLIYSLIRPEKF